jgi:tRNA(Ile)-lysidine synthase
MAAQAADRLAAGRRGCGRNALDVRSLAAAPVALVRRALVLWLHDNGLPPAAIGFDRVERVRRLLEPTVLKGRLALPGGRAVERRGGRLHLEPVERPSDWTDVDWPLPGRIEIPELGLRFMAEADRGFKLRRETGPGRWPAEAWIRRDSDSSRLFIRPWRPGDAYEPFGTGGHRKLQDIFTDAGIPAARRRRLPVILRGRDIVWLPGHRIARPESVPGSRAPSWRLRVEEL